MIAGLALYTLLVGLQCPLSAVAEEPGRPDLEKDCREAWDDLTRKLNDGKIYGRTDQAFNKQAGLDRDDDGPVSVLLRRTEALLQDVTRLGPTRDLAPLKV